MRIKFDSKGKKSGRTLKEGLLDYLNLLIKYKWIIIIATAAAAVAAGIFMFIAVILPPDKSPLPNKYQANSILLIAEEEEGGLSTLFYSLGIAPANRPSMYDYGTLAYRVLTTRSFIDQVVKELDTPAKYRIPPADTSANREAILSRTGFNYDRNTRTVTFSYEDTDPQFAKNILNRMVELLIDWFDNQGGTSKLNQIGILEEKLAELSVSINNLEGKIQNFQKEHMVLSVDEMANTQTEILSNLRTQLILKEMELKNYSKFSLIEDSATIRLKSERNNILETIQQVENGYTGEGKFMPSREELPQLALEFTHLNSDLQIQRRIYETLSQQYEVTKLTQETEARYKVLEWAEAPITKSSPSRLQLCLMITGVGFALGCVLVFLLDLLKNIKIIKNDDEEI